MANEYQFRLGLKCECRSRLATRVTVTFSLSLGFLVLTKNQSEIHNLFVFCRLSSLVASHQSSSCSLIYIISMYVLSDDECHRRIRWSTSSRCMFSSTSVISMYVLSDECHHRVRWSTSSRCMWSSCQVHVIHLFCGILASGIYILWSHMFVISR